MKLSEILKEHAAKLRQEIAGRTFSQEHPAPPIDEIEWAAEIVASAEADRDSPMYPGSWAVVATYADVYPIDVMVGQVSDCTLSGADYGYSATVVDCDGEEHIVDEYSDMAIESTHRTQEEAEAAMKEAKSAWSLPDTEDVGDADA